MVGALQEGIGVLLKSVFYIFCSQLFHAMQLYAYGLLLLFFWVMLLTMLDEYKFLTSYLLG
jgi:inner membrane protein involved in colicin E2 resistance